MQAGIAALIFTVEVIIEKGLWAAKFYQDIRSSVKDYTYISMRKCRKIWRV